MQQGQGQGHGLPSSPAAPLPSPLRPDLVDSAKTAFIAALAKLLLLPPGSSTQHDSPPSSTCPPHLRLPPPPPLLPLSPEAFVPAGRLLYLSACSTRGSSGSSNVPAHSALLPCLLTSLEQGLRTLLLQPQGPAATAARADGSSGAQGALPQPQLLALLQQQVTMQLLLLHNLLEARPSTRPPLGDQGQDPEQELEQDQEHIQDLDQKQQPSAGAGSRVVAVGTGAAGGLGSGASVPDLEPATARQLLHQLLALMDRLLPLLTLAEEAVAVDGGGATAGTPSVTLSGRTGAQAPAWPATASARSYSRQGSGVASGQSAASAEVVAVAAAGSVLRSTQHFPGYQVGL